MDPSEVRSIRERLDVTQFEFAQLLDVSRNTVVNWERGRSTPSPLKKDLIRQIDKQARQNNSDEFVRKLMALAAGGAFGALLGKLFSSSDSDS
jgi:DNA-binding XRE family transcriptional regulator